MSTREKILRNAKNLRKSSSPDLHNVFINPDYTIAQRAEMKTLREELKAKRAEGYDFTIRGFKLVPKARIVQKDA